MPIGKNPSSWSALGPAEVDGGPGDEPEPDWEEERDALGGSN